MITSPTRPMAWLSDAMIEKAPMIMQDILGGDGFAPDPAFGKGHILRDRLVQMMADHQHVEMLFQRVHRIGPCRVGG